MANLNITVRHGQAPSYLEQFVSDKVSRLDKFLHESSRIELIVDQSKDKYRCEMIVHSSRRGGQVEVHDQSDDLRSCVDLVVEKMSRRLSKLKDRRKEHHRGRAPEGGASDQDRDSATVEPSYEDIVDREIKGK